MHIWVDIRCLLWFLEQGPSPGLGLASFARMAAGKPQECSRLCRLSTGIRVADLGVCECAGARAQAITLARETIYPESYLPTLSGVFFNEESVNYSVHNSMEAIFGSSSPGCRGWVERALGGGAAFLSVDSPGLPAQGLSYGSNSTSLRS